jgi:hypothetical protein
LDQFCTILLVVQLSGSDLNVALRDELGGQDSVSLNVTENKGSLTALRRESLVACLDRSA